jgi:hypothetical protein
MRILSKIRMNSNGCHGDMSNTVEIGEVVHGPAVIGLNRLNFRQTFL